MSEEEKALLINLEQRVQELEEEVYQLKHPDNIGLPSRPSIERIPR